MHRRWPVVVALIATGLSMRTAVTSVGAALADIRHGLHLSGFVAGLLATLPVICFCTLGIAAPRLARRFGAHLVLLVALVTSTGGMVLRSIAGSGWLFLLVSVLALSGGAASNVLLPSLVKEHFPDRVAAMTAVYATAMAVGLSAAAGLTVPLGNVIGGWRFGIGCWAVVSAAAALAWLPLLGGHVRIGSAGIVSVRDLARTRIAWALVLFFGTQSFQAYIAFGWFATFLRDQGFSAAFAGALVAYFAALSIPTSMVVPVLAGRMSARPLVLATAVCYAACYTGLLNAPTSAVWLWMTLGGVASGSSFPLALALFGMRARTPANTAALSGFAQSGGYLIAGTGPLLVGVLIGMPHHWTGAFVALFSALAVMTAAGWVACAPADLESELQLPDPRVATAGSRDARTNR